MNDIEIDNMNAGKVISNDIEFAPGMPEVKEQYKSTVDYKFRRFPDWIIFNGAIAVLSGNALKVFAVLLAYTNNNSYIGELSNAKLSNLTGICRDNLYKYIKELEKFGILESITHGHVRKYHLDLKRKTYKELKQGTAETTRDLCIKRE